MTTLFVQTSKMAGWMTFHSILPHKKNQKNEEKKVVGTLHHTDTKSHGQMGAKPATVPSLSPLAKGLCLALKK